MGGSSSRLHSGIIEGGNKAGGAWYVRVANSARRKMEMSGFL